MLGWRGSRVVVASAVVVVATVLVLPATSAPARSSVPTASKQPVLKVKLPPQGGFTFARFQLLARAGTRLQRSPLVVTNRPRLPKGLVAAARIGRLPGGRGLDVFVVVIRKRILRASSIAAESTPDDALDLIFGTAVFLGSVSDKKLEPDWIQTFAKAIDLWRDDSLDQIHHAIAIERPPQALGLDALFKQSNTLSEFFVGSASPAPLFADVQALIDYLDEKPTPATQDGPTEIVNSLEKLPGIRNDLNGDKTVGGSPTPGPGPAVVRYSVPGFTVAFTGPKANLSPAVTDLVEGGSGCGDPARGVWLFPLTISGLGPSNKRSNAVSFAQQNLGTLITHNFTVNKTTPTGSTTP